MRWSLTARLGVVLDDDFLLDSGLGRSLRHRLGVSDLEGVFGWRTAWLLYLDDDLVDALVEACNAAAIAGLREFLEVDGQIAGLHADGAGIVFLARQLVGRDVEGEEHRC